MILAQMAFVILFLSTLLPFSGAVHQGFTPPLVLAHLDVEYVCLAPGTNGSDRDQYTATSHTVAGISDVSC